MGFILVIIALCVVAVLVAAAGAFVSTWAESRLDYENTIKFEDLKKYYNENPEPWILEYDSVKYIKQYGDYSFQVKTQRFSFGFIDYMRYLLWLLRVELDEAKKKNETILAEIEQDYCTEEK